MTCGEIADKLDKAKRKYDVCDNWRHAILYCVECGKRLGEFDMIYESHESHKYCHDCIGRFILPTPFFLSKSLTVLDDYGDHILLRYEILRLEETKQCYFSNKGRYIKIKGRRLYLPNN